MKKFLKFIKDANIIGFLLGALLVHQGGMDPTTANMIGGAVEQASDSHIESVLQGE